MIELFDNNTFFDKIGSDFEGILALYDYASISLDECYDRICEDIENEKLYIYHQKNGKVIFKLEATPFIYDYTGRASNNVPIICTEFMKIKGVSYSEKKAYLAELAKDWQNDFEAHCYSWDDLSKIGEFFYKRGKKYGLLKEFRENGII